MKHKFNILFFLAFQITARLWSQELIIDSANFYFADRIIDSKLKSGYTKKDPNIPAKYRDITEVKDFFGGIKNTWIKDFNLDLLLDYNNYYINIPTNSYVIFEFTNTLKDYNNQPDLILESCQNCHCNGIDKALISVSNNNIVYKKLTTIKDKEKLEIDFKDFNLKEVKYVKITGLSSSKRPYGYGLMNIYGFKSNSIKITNPKEKLVDTLITQNKKIVLQDMLFEFNDSLIRNEEVLILDSICSILIKEEFDSLVISGHTDSIGNSDYNYRLSLARANSIAKYLNNYGINRNKLKVRGYGEMRLLKNIEGIDPRNRRVEIEIFNN
ncbi:MAG: OmpA family protein [Bacteroidales bacterium]|nr:OmpA family protein [Bacteroidales bacterium]